jgi:hypothetical protein
MNTIPCNCEHVSHMSIEDVPEFPEFARDGHSYLGVPAGNSIAMWVEAICDDCANGHMSKYLV